MKAGRGENGYSATLDILPADPTDAYDPVLEANQSSTAIAATKVAMSITSDEKTGLVHYKPVQDSVTEEKPAPKPVSTRKPFAGLGSAKVTAPAPTVSEDGEIIEPDEVEEPAGISSGEDRGEAEPGTSDGDGLEYQTENQPAPKPAVKSIFSKAG